MSLVKCTECGKEISSKAITCPQCGTTSPVPPAVSNRTFLKFLGIFAAVLVVLFLYLIFGAPGKRIDISNDIQHKLEASAVKNDVLTVYHNADVLTVHVFFTPDPRDPFTGERVRVFSNFDRNALKEKMKNDIEDAVRKAIKEVGIFYYQEYFKKTVLYNSAEMSDNEWDIFIY